MNKNLDLKKNFNVFCKFLRKSQYLGKEINSHEYAGIVLKSSI